MSGNTGAHMRKPCRFANRGWESRSACARALGLNHSTLSRWLDRGLTDIPFREFEGHKCRTWKELADALGVHITTAQAWVARGSRPNCTGGPNKPCRVHGVDYESEVEAAKANGVTKQAISHAILSGKPWARFIEAGA